MRPRSSTVLGLVAGALFALGLVVSGMTRPEKVLGFLDVAGRWDASLSFVMLGAIGVHFWAYRFIGGRPAPLFGGTFSVPSSRDIDPRLCVGAAVFGVGWGLGGYCPGPALVAVVSGGTGVTVFVAAMIVGMWAAEPLLASGETSAGLAAPDRSAPDRSAPVSAGLSASGSGQKNQPE
jgi:uncharacterized membrane protein YedE/YeeE